MLSVYDISNRYHFNEIINKQGYINGIEIGVQHGHFSRHLLKSTNIYMYLVDPWSYQDNYEDKANVSDEEQEKIYKSCIKKLKRYPGRYEIYRRLSFQAVESFDNEFLDFVYIDANHKYEEVLNDMTLWYPKLKKGGLFAGHDFDTTGVKCAVCDFVINKNVILHATREPSPSWWFIKI